MMEPVTVPPGRCSETTSMFSSARMAESFDVSPDASGSDVVFATGCGASRKYAAAARRIIAMPMLMVLIISIVTRSAALYYSHDHFLTRAFHLRLPARLALRHAMLSPACMMRIMFLRFDTTHIALIPFRFSAALFT